MSNATEEEWLYFFENADYVVTDSQHGSAFSILLNKQFICCSNKKWGQARYESLFGLLGLRDRQKLTLKDIADSDLWNKKINYERVNEILECRVRFSCDWLADALGFDTEKVKKNTVAKVSLENRCSGCSACEKICPKGAITMKKNNRGFLYPEINAGKCVLCGICLKKCVNESPEYVNYEKPECYAMMASDKQRSVSSSGGMFTVAAEYIIDNGGYVCGAAFRDDFSVEHIIINNKDDIPKLRGSKYMQSNMGNVYTEIKKLLNDGKTVLFTGMPCQAAGLNAYLGKKYDNLYTIDLLCHGITSSKVFEKYRQDVLEGKRISDLQFKAKKPWGWHAGVNAVFEDGTKYSVPLQTDPYFVAYLKSISKNSACELCRSSALPRQSDLTIGDFWGIPKNDPEMHDKKGTSVVLVNSENGTHLFEILKPFMKKWKKEPLEYAINNNKVIIKPYQLHKNHEAFFENFGDLNFAALTNGCFYNRLYDEQKIKLLKTVPENEHELYYLARTVSQKSHGRKIVIWGRAVEFEKVLSKYFGLSVEFSVAKTQSLINNTSVFPMERVKGKSSEYYIAALEANYSKQLYDIMYDYGYTEGEDFIFRKHEPVILENFDLSQGRYSDMYGNTVEGFSGIISNIIIRGCNNHIVIGENVKHVENLSFDVTSNAYIRIENECNFTGALKFEVRGFSGSGRIIIKERCKFMNGEFRLFTSLYNTSILINEDCTFGNDTEFHANSGKKIIIGRDCMFSMNIDLWAGDGHSIFDVNTGKNINSLYNTLTPERNQIFIGDHVWVAKGAFIMHGTNIGSGSIIGAKSVVKGIYPNNCSVAGNPSKLIKKDVAWSREMSANDPDKCIREEYFKQTLESKPSVSGRNVLIIGGTKIMGKQLVKELIRLGNNVTIATRGIHSDDFGTDVNRLIMDVSDRNSVRKALKGRYFDVVFDNLAYCSNYAENVLNNVKCGRYIQLSSVEEYKELSMDISEDRFDPESIELVMCNKKDVGYIEGKRQAEALVYQKYKNVSAVTVRLPYVVPTSRLKYYCDNIVNEVPMNISDTDRAFTFVKDTDVGKFLPWIAAQEYCGPLNFAGKGFVTVGGIIEYIEKKTGKKALIENNPSLPEEPFFKFNENSYSMNLDRLISLNYKPSELDDWFWKSLDEYIEQALASYSKNKK